MNKQGKSRKLTLSKETLRILDDGLLRGVAGGATYGTCASEVTRCATNCNCTDVSCGGTVTCTNPAECG